MEKLKKKQVKLSKKEPKCHFFEDFIVNEG